MGNELYWIWLTCHIKSNNTISQLLEHFGSVSAIYNSRESDLRGVFADEVSDLLIDKSLNRAERIWGTMVRIGAFVVTYDSPEYPEALKNIYDPPYVLYMKGTLFDWNSFIAIGVVGTRRCTDYGRTVTDSLVRELAKNDIMIISGLASGIDAVASKAAFAEEKPSVAVLGCPIDKIYPRENEQLFKCVENTGLIISEYAPGTQISRASFPRRNRIISGLSRGVLITEAPEKSGALITARFAMEQGRDVFAVMGNITNKESAGSNRLIIDGAIPVMSVYDILKEYPEYVDMKPEVLRYYRNKQAIQAENKRKTAGMDLTGFTHVQQSIIKCVGSGRNHLDDISRELGMSNSIIANELLMLELMGMIRSNPGNTYELKGKE